MTFAPQKVTGDMRGERARRLPLSGLTRVRPLASPHVSPDPGRAFRPPDHLEYSSGRPLELSFFCPARRHEAYPCEQLQCQPRPCSSTPQSFMEAADEDTPRMPPSLIMVCQRTDKRQEPVGNLTLTSCRLRGRPTRLCPGFRLRRRPTRNRIPCRKAIDEEKSLPIHAPCSRSRPNVTKRI